MKAPNIVICAVLLSLMAGCIDPEAHSVKVNKAKNAKARAEAARKEMETLPKAFQTPDYFRLNPPAATSDAPPSPGKTDR